MAVAVMYDLPGMTHQRYGAVMRAINFDRRRPPELKAHAAWEKEDGSGWQIFEVWESDEALQTFLQEKLAPPMGERGQDMTLTILSARVHQTYTGD